MYAQRDERLRERLGSGLQALRSMFERFAEASAADAGVERAEDTGDEFATVVLAMSIGMPMLKLIDPDAVPAELLGAVISVLVRALESDPEARLLLTRSRAALLDG